jgi:dual specificity MAP kinase phosphatase
LPAWAGSHPRSIEPQLLINAQFRQVRLRLRCCRYPSEILPRVLYLGEWSHAENHERLQDLGVRYVITIHNDPGEWLVALERRIHIPCMAHRSDSSTLQPPDEVSGGAENMKLPPRFRHLRFQLADVDTQNVTPYFNASYDFIEEARAAGHGVW